MWRIYGLVFFNDKTYFQVKGEKRFDAERIKAFLLERGLLLPDLWKLSASKAMHRINSLKLWSRFR